MKSREYNDPLVDFSSLMENLPIAMFMVDKEGNFQCYNQHWLRSTWHVDAEIKSVKDLDTAEHLFSEKIFPMLEQIFSGKKPEDIVVPIVHKISRHKQIFKLSGSLFNGKSAIFSATDVSNEIKLQEASLEKKQQLFSIIKSLGDGVYKLDTKGNYKKIWANDSSRLIFDLSNETKTLSDHFPDDIVQLLLENINLSIFGKQMVEIEFPFVDGEQEKWFLAKLAPLGDKDPHKGEEVTAIFREITEDIKIRRQNEYKNRLINQLTTINNGPILHIIKGDQVKFDFISGNVTALTGYLPKELEKLNWLDIIYDHDREFVKKNLEELFIKKNETIRNLIYRIVTKEGDIQWITNQISKSDDDDTDTIFGVMLNVTEIQMLNHKLKQRDRILTNSGRVAMIGGWEYDFKLDQSNFTDEIYDLFEVEKGGFNIWESVDFYLQEDATIMKHHLDYLMKFGVKYDLELRIRTKKGNIKWVRTVGCAELLNNRMTHIYGIVQDISEKKEKDLILQESERRFNAAFELAPIGMGLVSPRGQWIKVNRALSHFFEFSDLVLKKIPLGKVSLNEDLMKAFKSTNKTKTNNQSIYQFENEYLTESGKVKWGRLNINSVKDEKGNTLYFIFQIVDVTSNKEFEKNLLIAKIEAEAATKAKSEFLSTMSHEIRTPLYGVIGMTNLLLEEINDPHQLEQLLGLKFSSDSLLLIVNDILDYSKIKSGALTLELKPFVLEKLIDAVRESHIQKANELGNKISIHCSTDLPVKVIGDKLRIGQILNNLVSNAIKFTKGGTIEIRVRKVKQNKDWHTINFSIKDSGIGIPQNMQSLIFEQFTQAESGTTRKYGGTGLGLSIVRGLLASMDSEAKLFSQLGKGTEITLDLILQSAKPGKKLKSDEVIEKEKDLQHKIILLVEDNAISRMVAHDFIRKWNGETLIAVNGLEAVNVFIKNIDKIALVLMDLQMPLMNGFEATKQIKKIKPEIPIIALTASIGDKSILDSKDHGMSAYLIKPFRPNDFYKIIKKHIL